MSYIAVSRSQTEGSCKHTHTHTHTHTHIYAYQTMISALRKIKWWCYRAP